jgi:hypothetical protein
MSSGVENAFRLSGSLSRIGGRSFSHTVSPVDASSAVMYCRSPPSLVMISSFS